ncbi:MAG TPA: condensation domain-containing protein, partial [Longimicrobium sp.]|nr:condensation domain-containing protein [Longimicrobium sp.]
HEVLRTTLRPGSGGGSQRVHPHTGFALEVEDLGAVPEAGRAGEARRRVAAEAALPFALERDTPFRARLLRLAADDHVLLVTLHHVAGDGWSMGIVLGELGVLYRAFAAGGPAPLAELPLQYADFTTWQRGWLAGDVLRGQLAFWRRRLAGLPPVLALPTDGARPAARSHLGARHPVEVPAAVAGALGELARGAGATPFMVLLAAYQILLARWCGQDDFAVGVPVAGRARPELDGVVGCFLNTLCLRSDLGGDPTFRELLGRVRDATLDAFAHQDVPFELLVRELAPPRALSHSPLFQVSLVLQNQPAVAMSLGEVEVASFTPDSPTAKHDLALMLRESGGGFTGGLQYAAELFRPATIARLVAQWGALLESIAAQPDAPVSTLSLATRDDRARAAGAFALADDDADAAD